MADKIADAREKLWAADQRCRELLQEIAEHEAIAETIRDLEPELMDEVEKAITDVKYASQDLHEAIRFPG
jgi:transposase